MALAVVLVPTAGARPPSACSLLTNAEVTKVFGAKIEFRKAGAGDCTWQGSPLGNFTSAAPQLSLSVAQVTKAEFLKISRSELIAGPTPGSMQRAIPTPVRGVGELAFSIEEAGEDLLVWAHGSYLEVSITLVATPLEAEKKLAALALARL